MNQASVRHVAAPQAYADFDRLPIGGTWRTGETNRIREDRDPYTNQVIFGVPQADRSNLHDADATAAQAV